LINAIGTRSCSNVDWSQRSSHRSTAVADPYEAATKRLVDAEARLGRFQAAIASGVDPAALVDVINEAQAQGAAAQAELDGTPVPTSLAAAEVYAMVDLLGAVGMALADVAEERLANLYSALDLQVRYKPESPTWASVWHDG
jgi:hypothetical protein